MGWSGPEFGVIRLGALHSRSHLKAPPALERVRSAGEEGL